MRSSQESFGLNSFHSIPELTKDLLSKNFILRKKAREELVEIGEPSLDFLLELSNSKDEKVRWEAIITIVQIGSNNTLEVLLNALKDDEFSIRWLAAEGLINLGKYAVIPLLQAMQKNPDSVFIRRGAHHVLQELRKSGIFNDNYQLVDQLGNEFDHSSLSLKVQKTIDSIRLT
jgi:HEAT repeat protein